MINFRAESQAGLGNEAPEVGKTIFLVTANCFLQRPAAEKKINIFITRKMPEIQIFAE